MPLNLDQNSVVVAIQDQVSSGLPDEAIILNLKSDVYYGIAAVGARIWNLLEQPITVQEIRNTILSEYEVDPERCEADILRFLQKLMTEGLIEISNEPTA
ncbi:MAG: PqqD family peptide modification chaperone [Aphanothece sp. CMT-3BRIN-NPC111]|nr:PqqD family peptide modification chaperone [Aphanothece sp. CMT-3BRIN-NPC111]